MNDVCNLMENTVTIVNNAVLYNWSLLRVNLYSHQNKTKEHEGDGC